MKITYRFCLVAIASLGLLTGSVNVYAAAPSACTISNMGTTYTDQTTCKIYTCTASTSGRIRTYSWTTSTLAVDQKCAKQKAGQNLQNQLRNQPTKPPTPTTSSSAISGLAPPKTKTVNYTSQITNTTAATDFNFSGTDFPPCPRDISGYPLNPDLSTQTKSYGVTTDIQDINTNMPKTTTDPTYSTATPPLPPNQCVVRSVVTCTVNGFSGQPCTDFTNTTQFIDKAVAAVCPDNYVQVGAFDMEPEVVYHSSDDTKTSPTNIQTLADYQYYKDHGYTCSVPTTKLGPWKSPCRGAVAGDHIVYTAPFTRNVPYLLQTVTGKSTDVGVVMFGDLEYWDRNCYTGNLTCSGWVDPSCNLNGDGAYSKYGPVDATIDIYLAGGGLGYSTKFEFSYGHVSCTIFAGKSFTSRMAPRSLVCARIKTQYDKLNK